MQYLVSAENTTYHHWQLELLIESFKINNLQDSLIIAFAESSEKHLMNFSDNLSKHKNIFIHNNIGRKNNYLPLNKCYAIVTALQQKIITSPFTILEPDMLLISPIKNNKNITFQINPDFTLDNIKKIYNIEEKIKILEDFKNIELPWLPIGSIMSFNMSIEFFQKALENIYLINQESKSYWSEKIGWLLTFLEYYGYSNCEAHNYESSLLDNKLNNFIHYQHGLPPVFHKLMYKFEEPYGFSMGNLFETILENNPTYATNHFQKVVNSYLKSKTKENLPITQTLPYVKVINKK